MIRNFPNQIRFLSSSKNIQVRKLYPYLYSTKELCDNIDLSYNDVRCREIHFILSLIGLTFLQSQSTIPCFSNFHSCWYNCISIRKNVLCSLRLVRTRSLCVCSFLQQKIRDALTHEGLTKDLFTRTQYDTLRRLRSYWIPRFLVHKEKTNDDEM